MRKIFCFLVACVASMSIIANQQGHFFLNVESEKVQVSSVESKFADWLDLPENTTFILFRDTTDNIGIRHLSYQQYVEGTIVSNAIVLVHAKNEIVYAVNGDIMDASTSIQHLQKKITSEEAIRKVRKKSNIVTAPLCIIRTIVNGKTIYRYAYEVLADDLTNKQYVDAESGEIIKTIPLIYSADVQGTATTMYYGTQPITCYEDNGIYYLRDKERGIVTLDATNNYLDDDQYVLDGIYRMPDTAEASVELMKFINRCPDITNTSSTWYGFWMMFLDSIKINDVRQNSKWYSIGEGTADVYLKIKDGAGNLLFTTSRHDDPTFPITIEIGINVATPPYSIEVWDYDPIGSDDLIETVTLETIRGENRTYDLLDFAEFPEIVDLSCTINSLGRKPFYDAHWGMGKTIDFYRKTFNRNSYDNKGSYVYQLVNQPSTPMGVLGGQYANACALGALNPGLMIYGMGVISSKIENYAKSYGPFVAIDVLAHEFSHLVTEKNGNGGLIYLGESGALNESFSDIMGISVKNFATNSNDWMCGSEMMINVSNMRSFSNPNNSSDGYAAQPDTYGGQYWIDTELSKDNGGVHTNSGVQNYWFYLLSEGGNGTNDNSYKFSVTGIGIDKAVQIAYRNLIYYLTPEATFEDSRNGSIQAAIDLYGSNSQEVNSVVAAWNAVGISDKDVFPENMVTIPFYEPFTSNAGLFTIDDINVYGIDHVWQWANASYGMKATAYVNNSNHAAESWLVSPPIFLGDVKNAELSFQHAVNKGTPNNLRVKIRKYYSNVWNDLNIPDWPIGNNWNFISTNVSLDQHIGYVVQIAFVYISSTTDCPTWEIKDFAVQGDKVVTNITDLSAGTSDLNNIATKFIRDGQLFILRKGKMYNVQGQEVK